MCLARDATSTVFTGAAGSSCYALRLLNSDFCESSQGNNLLHVGRKEPHVSKISWHHALGSTLFSNSEILKYPATTVGTPVVTTLKRKFGQFLFGRHSGPNQSDFEQHLLLQQYKLLWKMSSLIYYH